MVLTLDKHDCFIQNSEGKVIYKAFSFANNYEGFEELYSKIISYNDDDIKVGLEATGHYSHNLLVFLLSKELPTFSCTQVCWRLCLSQSSRTSTHYQAYSNFRR